MNPAQASNILVDNDTSCVISDFGQSEMKTEVYRITRASQPRTFEIHSRHRPLTLDLIRLCFYCRWDVALASPRTDARRPCADAGDGRLRVRHFLRGDPHHGRATVAVYG